MNNFIGFNPESLKNQIKEFYDSGMQIREYLENGSLEFFNSLKSSWFSPKAVEFEKYFYDINRCIYNLGVAYGNVAAHMVDAYNIHARANNYPIINNDYEVLEFQQEGAQFGEYTLLEQSPEGIVGMDKAIVNSATSSFSLIINTALDDIYASYQMPAFYDEDGSQVISFVNTVNKMRENLKVIFESLSVNINQSITDEVDLTTGAVLNATNTLNGNL